jgi:uncharacterized tellurite resistance protein B-like protein
MPEPRRFTDLPADVRVAWFGAMFAIAASDGDTARTEILTILDRLDSEGLSADEWRTVRRYIADAPDLVASLRVLANQVPAVRYGAMIHLVDVAWADGTMAPAERQRLDLAAKTLAIPAEHAKAIEHAIGTIREDLDGEIASPEALAAFMKAGVPQGVIVE